MIQAMNRIAFALVFIVFIAPLVAELIIRFCMIPFSWIFTGEGFEVVETNYVYRFMKRMGSALNVDFEL